MNKFKSARFGILEYEPDDVITLPAGLVGLPALRRWIMLDMDQRIPMKWLQSIDRGDFCLPVTDPSYFCDAYEVPVSAAIQQQLAVSAAEEVAVLIIATVHEEGTRITGNLLAPLVVNTRTRIGLQLPLQDDSLPVRQEINYLKFGLAVETKAAENNEDSALGIASLESRATPGGERLKVTV